MTCFLLWSTNTSTNSAACKGAGVLESKATCYSVHRHLFDPPAAWRAHMTTIKKADLIQSVADALQFISYYHPADYIRALGRAYEREQSAAAKDAIAQILSNSRM